MVGFSGHLGIGEARAVTDDAVVVAGEERLLLGDHLVVSKQSAVSGKNSGD